VFSKALLVSDLVNLHPAAQDLQCYFLLCTQNGQMHHGLSSILLITLA